MTQKTYNIGANDNLEHLKNSLEEVLTADSISTLELGTGSGNDATCNNSNHLSYLSFV